MYESCLKDSVYILSENTFKPSSLKGVKRERKMVSIIDIKVWWFAFMISPLTSNTFEKS
jgi:capsid portal protein